MPRSFTELRGWGRGEVPRAVQALHTTASQCIPFCQKLPQLPEKTVGKPRLGFLWLQQGESLEPRSLGCFPVQERKDGPQL